MSAASRVPSGYGPAQPVAARARSVEANARLTGTLGLILLVLMIIEVATDIIGVRNVLTLHATIGFVATPLVLLKIGSTGWRMVRYYRGDPAYRERGAPRPYLRVLGPILVILTVTVFASGIAAYVGPSWLHQAAVTTHKVTFYLWLIALIGHSVPHFTEALHLTGKDFFRRSRRLVPGLAARRTAAIGGAVIGIAVAAIWSGHAADYLTHYPRIKGH